MSKNIGTHVENRFYTSPSGRSAAKAAVSPYISMLRVEAAIRAVVTAAADPKVVAFPIRQALRRRK
jgi:hypothetical protein